MKTYAIRTGLYFVQNKEMRDYHDIIIPHKYENITK